MTGPGRDDIRDTLAAALAEHAYHNLVDVRLALAELTPVVRRIAADELRALADRLSSDEDAPTDAALEGLDYTLRVLRHNADELDPR